MCSGRILSREAWPAPRKLAVDRRALHGCERLRVAGGRPRTCQESKRPPGRVRAPRVLRDEFSTVPVNLEWLRMVDAGYEAEFQEAERAHDELGERALREELAEQQDLDRDSAKLERRLTRPVSGNSSRPSLPRSSSRARGARPPGAFLASRARRARGALAQRLAVRRSGAGCRRAHAIPRSQPSTSSRPQSMYAKSSEPGPQSTTS
jgi:hypothetical protein